MSCHDDDDHDASRLSLSLPPPPLSLSLRQDMCAVEEQRGGFTVKAASMSMLRKKPLYSFTDCQATLWSKLTPPFRVCEMHGAK